MTSFMTSPFEEQGQALVEYALILSLVSLVSVAP
jgi:Flp pilus assembly pilin Flp